MNLVNITFCILFLLSAITQEGVIVYIYWILFGAYLTPTIFEFQNLIKMPEIKLMLKYIFQRTMIFCANDFLKNYIVYIKNNTINNNDILVGCDDDGILKYLDNENKILKSKNLYINFKEIIGDFIIQKKLNNQVYTGIVGDKKSIIVPKFNKYAEVNNIDDIIFEDLESDFMLIKEKTRYTDGLVHKLNDIEKIIYQINNFKEIRKTNILIIIINFIYHYLLFLLYIIIISICFLLFFPIIYLKGINNSLEFVRNIWRSLKIKKYWIGKDSVS